MTVSDFGKATDLSAAMVLGLSPVRKFVYARGAELIAWALNADNAPEMLLHEHLCNFVAGYYGHAPAIGNTYACNCQAPRITHTRGLLMQETALNSGNFAISILQAQYIHHPDYKPEWDN